MNQKDFLKRLAELADEAEIHDVNTELFSARLTFNKSPERESMTEKLRAAGVASNILVLIEAHGVPADVLEAINLGRKINAIKLWREHYNTSLADAKTAIDALVAV